MNKKDLLRSLFLPGKGSRDLKLRNLCIAVLFLLVVYAVSNFPQWYAGGLTATEVIGIASTMLAAIVAFYMERRFSSRAGGHEPDWCAPAGTMRGFSFDNRVCLKCGKRRILASKGKDNRPVFIAPGQAAPSGSMLFYCAHCGDMVSPDEAKRVPYESGAVYYGVLSSLAPELKTAKKFRLNKGYQNRSLLVTLIVLAGLASSIYFSARGVIWLLLPLIVGYFFFVCFATTISNLFTSYHVCSAGVVARGFWGATLFSFDDAVALVKFSKVDSSAALYGFYTAKENLIISPIIDDYTELVGKLRTLCLKNHISVIE